MVDKAYIIDQKTGTTFLTKDIEKKMTNVCVAFEVLKGATPEQTREGNVKPGFKYVQTHMILDIKNGQQIYLQRQTISSQT